MTRRIALAGVLAVCVTAVLVGVIAYVLVARDARQLENRLLVQAVSHPGAALSPQTTGSELAQMSTRGGRVLRDTVALAALGGLPRLHRGYVNLTLDGRHLRVLTRRVGRRRLFSVAVSDAPARSSLARLRRGVIIAMLAAAAAASLLLVWLTRRALGPVRETAEVADTIVRTGQLDARVPEPVGQDEVARLTRSINAMLTHLQASDQALRRFVADASHELRSPLTTLVGNLELLAGGQMLAADRDAALADARSEALRLGELVEELLGLARADTVVPEARVDLGALVRELTPAPVIEPARRMVGRFGPRRGATADGPPERIEVLGDAVALRAMIRNLVENAERYGGGAELSLQAREDSVQLRVVDHGPGVPAAEREVIFARFRRGRAGEGRPGSGLGLAIVAATARAHGGRVDVEDTPGGGATFVVRLPGAPGG